MGNHADSRAMVVSQQPEDVPKKRNTWIFQSCSGGHDAARGAEPCQGAASRAGRFGRLLHARQTLSFKFPLPDR